MLKVKIFVIGEDGDEDAGLCNIACQGGCRHVNLLELLRIQPMYYPVFSLATPLAFCCECEEILFRAAVGIIFALLFAKELFCA